METFGFEVGFELADVDHVEMKDGSGEEDGGARLGRLVKMLHRPGSAGGHDRGPAVLGEGADERKIISGTRAVPGLAGREDDVDSGVVDELGEFERVGARCGASAVDVDFVAGVSRLLKSSAANINAPLSITRNNGSLSCMSRLISLAIR